jgi:glycosyltransferase involved in cell wall biosynthesis
MSRLIFVPQFPTNLRYQQTWYLEFPKQFKKYYDEVIVLGQDYAENYDPEQMFGSFSPVNNSTHFENCQINDFMDLDIQEDDHLFLSDLSFPGFFSNVLYHKPMKNAFAYCHATSLNKYDYFQPVRYSKYPCEISHSKLFKKVFVGSEYHKRKLNWKNVEIVGLPVPPYKTFREEKKYDIISVARPNKQKVTKNIEDKVEKEFCKIERSTFYFWEQYYKFLSQGKILLITSKEDTFNYSVMEAIMNGTVALAPDKCAFPELLRNDYLYKDWDDLRNKIWQVLNDKLLPQEKLLNQELCDNFYENIIDVMKG